MGVRVPSRRTSFLCAIPLIFVIVAAVSLSRDSVPTAERYIVENPRQRRTCTFLALPFLSKSLSESSLFCLEALSGGPRERMYPKLSTFPVFLPYSSTRGPT